MSSEAPRVGVVGGGQLARMMANPAADLGIGIRVLAADPTESAAQVISDSVIGSPDDAVAVEHLAAGCTVITFDHEHVPTDVLRAVEAGKTAVRPGPGALLAAQDKAHMRRVLSDAGIPCPAWATLDPSGDPHAAEQVIADFGERTGWPIVMKTSRGGYDGRGVWVVDSLVEAREVVADTPLQAGAVWLLEEHVAFEVEVSAQIARAPSGQAVAYPVVETTQIDGMCREVVAPAPSLDDQQQAHGRSIALRIAQILDVTGMLAVEMFVTRSGFLVNELAMRPHNSGHWSIEGAVTSQFENHLRAVLDWPLGSTELVGPVAVMVNIVGSDFTDLSTAAIDVMAHDPHVKIHLYGKAAKPGRKLGHVTVVGTDPVAALAQARMAARHIGNGPQQARPSAKRQQEDLS